MLEALAAGISAAQPKTVLQETLLFDGERLYIADESYNVTDYDDILLLGGGNAAGRIASELTDMLGNVLDGGVVVTDDPAPAGSITVVAGTHPIPDEDNVMGTQQLLNRARMSDADTLVLVAVTGGGSALLPAPVEGVSLSDLRTLTDELLASGEPISRINAVRKHVSALKGGRLVRELAPADTVGLVFSDVASGDPSVVASGPLSPDETTYDDALAVLSSDTIEAPESVVSHLEAGAAGDMTETPARGDSAFDDVDVHVLADGFTALSAAADVCEKADVTPLILSSLVRGEAREAAKTHVAVAEECRRTGVPLDPPAAILAGGETTVTIAGNGVGGPNQEFALSAACELPAGVVLGTVDTDGIDGPTDAAGALVTSETVMDPQTARAALADNAAYDFLDTRDALLYSGQTGTNVNDLRVLIVPE